MQSFAATWGDMHSVNISDGTWSALERIRSARGLRSITAVVVAMAAERDPAAAPHLAGPTHGPALALWAELCGDAGPTTLRVALEREGAAERLAGALTAAGIRTAPTTQGIGFAFRSLRGRVADGMALRCEHDRAGVARWYVERVPAAPEAAPAPSGH